MLQYDASTGEFQRVVVAPRRGGLQGAAGIALQANGQLLVSSLFTDEILKYHAKTGRFLGEFVSARMSGPTAFDMF